MGEKTTILVSKRTRNALRALRIARRESYDEIINRLIRAYKGRGKG